MLGLGTLMDEETTKILPNALADVAPMFTFPDLWSISDVCEMTEHIVS